MKIALTCPNCNIQKTFTGKSGEKKIVTCPNCNKKGVIVFPKLDRFDLYGFKVSKKKFIASMIVILVVLSIFLSVIIPVLQGNLKILTVLSGSMEPDIHTGDLVFTSKIDPYNLEVDDVITFKYDNDPDPNRYITHRVVKILNEESGISFVTKGDANEDPDSRRVFPDEVVGKVTFVLPYMGYFSEFARSKIGFFLFLAIPAVLIIINEVYRIFKITKKEKKENIRG